MINVVFKYTLLVVVAIAATNAATIPTEVTGNGCFTDGLQYSGIPVTMQKDSSTPTFTNVTSPEECQWLCQGNDECNFFTWNNAGHKKNPNTCWMKIDKGKVKTGKSTKLSGPKCCSDCFLPGVSYAGMPVAMQQNSSTPTLTNVTSPEQCQELCQGYQGTFAMRFGFDQDVCNFFTWNNANHPKNPNTCWLKTDTGDIRTNKKQADKISGPRCCPSHFGMPM